MPEKQRLGRRRGRGRGGTNFKWLSCNIIPALNDFHPIHQFHVFVLVLNLGHDHSSRRGVKLEEEKLVHLHLIKGYDYNSFRVKKQHKSEPRSIMAHSILHACAQKGRIINRDPLSFCHYLWSSGPADHLQQVGLTVLLTGARYVLHGGLDHHQMCW